MLGLLQQQAEPLYDCNVCTSFINAGAVLGSVNCSLR